MRNLRGILALAAVATLGACDSDRTSVATPVGPLSIDAAVGPAAARIPAGRVTIGAVNGEQVATVTTQWLRAVSGASYTFWYVSRDPATGLDVYHPATVNIREFFMRDSLSGGTSGTPVVNPLTGEVIRVVDTNVVDTSGTATGYAGTDDATIDSVRIQLVSTDDSTTGNPALGRNAVVVGLGGGTPADAMFLWRRTAVGGNGAMSFGNFGGNDPVNLTSVADYIYTVTGGGTVGLRGPEANVVFRELARPPVGFFYRGFLIDTADVAVMVDTLRSAYNPVAELSRVSLYDADVNGLLPGIAVTAITHSQIRNCASGSATTACANTMALPTTSTFAGQARFVLSLEPKGANNDFVQTVILAATIPERAW